MASSEQQHGGGERARGLELAVADQQQRGRGPVSSPPTRRTRRRSPPRRRRSCTPVNACRQRARQLEHASASASAWRRSERSSLRCVGVGVAQPVVEVDGRPGRSRRARRSATLGPGRSRAASTSGARDHRRPAPPASRRRAGAARAAPAARGASRPRARADDDRDEQAEHDLQVVVAQVGREQVDGRPPARSATCGRRGQDQLVDPPSAHDRLPAAEQREDEQRRRITSRPPAPQRALAQRDDVGVGAMARPRERHVERRDRPGRAAATAARCGRRAAPPPRRRA